MAAVSLMTGLTTIGSIRSAVRSVEPARTMSQVNTAVDHHISLSTQSLS
jgi:hypothetical protein